MSFYRDLKRYAIDKYHVRMRRIRRILRAAPIWVLAAGIALTGFGIGRYAFLTSQRKDQDMASYWGQDSDIPMRYMSVYARGSRPAGSFTPPLYINQKVSLNRSDILQIRTSLQGFTDSATPIGGKSGVDANGRPRGWEDCFSSFLTATVSTSTDAGITNPRPLTSTVDVIASEGNFTAFHPLSFMSGGFLPEIEADNRQIVINDVLAWKLYKSYEVVGNKISLWGENFTVIGVAVEPSDSISRSAKTQQPRVYIYFSAMEALAPLVDPETAGSSGSQNTSGGLPSPTPTPAASSDPSNNVVNTNVRPVYAIQCYEAMLTEVVKNVAKNDMASSIPGYSPADPYYYVISNTGRYNVIYTWKYVIPIGKTSALLDGYEFPYWEKTAQLTTMHLFADECFVILGVIVMISGGIMAALRSRKMSRK